MDASAEPDRDPTRAGDTFALYDYVLNTVVRNETCDFDATEEEYQSFVMMHELGHNFGLEHRDDDGLMDTSPPCYDDLTYKSYYKDDWQNLDFSGGEKITPS